MPNIKTFDKFSLRVNYSKHFAQFVGIVNEIVNGNIIKNKDKTTIT